MTADSPFIINDGLFGNESLLVVGRPLLAGAYDLVITAFAALSRASARIVTAWYRIRVEGQLILLIIYSNHKIHFIGITQ